MHLIEKKFLALNNLRLTQSLAEFITNIIKLSVRNFVKNQKVQFLLIPFSFSLISSHSSFPMRTINLISTSTSFPAHNTSQKTCLVTKTTKEISSGKRHETSRMDTENKIV
jgi:hypothetical protein